MPAVTDTVTHEVDTDTQLSLLAMRVAVASSGPLVEYTPSRVSKDEPAVGQQVVVRNSLTQRMKLEAAGGQLETRQDAAEGKNKTHTHSGAVTTGNGHPPARVMVILPVPVAVHRNQIVLVAPRPRLISEPSSVVPIVLWVTRVLAETVTALWRQHIRRHVGIEHSPQ